MISLIVAVGRNLEIGWQNRLPWFLPNDLRHFKEKTKGRTLIMGGTTYRSMLDVNLNDRVTFVLSRTPKKTQTRAAYTATSVLNAVLLARHNLSNYLTSEIVVVGGVGVFREALPLIDRAYVTLVEGDFEADRWFPVGLDHFFDWRCSRSETFLPDAKNAYQHTIYQFERPN